MASNEYAAFAAFYDRLTGNVDYTGLAGYLRALFIRYGGTMPGTVLDKTTPRLIQFHIFKNAVNPPFLGGFSIFATVAA